MQKQDVSQIKLSGPVPFLLETYLPHNRNTHSTQEGTTIHVTHAFLIDQGSVMDNLLPITPQQSANPSLTDPSQEPHPVVQNRMSVRYNL